MRVKTILACSLALFRIGSLIAETNRVEIEKAMEAYYSQWIGALAPELPLEVTDIRSDPRLQLKLSDIGAKSPLQLKDYRGKKVLLYSFDAGDFVQEPNWDSLLHELRNLKTVRAEQGEKLFVIGFTYGALFALPEEWATKLDPLLDFPIVNNTNVRLQEPYNLLQRWPSGILIDPDGIVIDIYPHQMTKELFRKAVMRDPWRQAARPRPKVEPPHYVKEYSQRKPFHLFIYRTNLLAGSTFRRGFGTRSSVYTKGEVPPDAVRSLTEIEGKKLVIDVRPGESIRKVHFE